MAIYDNLGGGGSGGASGNNSLLLELYSFSANTNPSQASSVFLDESYFEKTDEGFVCKKACSGTIHIFYTRPAVTNVGSGNITVGITQNGVTIYNKTTNTTAIENLEFNCNVGDLIRMSCRSSASNYGMCVCVASFVNN